MMGIDLNINPLMKIQKSGYAKEEAKEDITHNVSDVIKILFGNTFNENDIDSFEKCFLIVKDNQNFKYKNISEEILRSCAKSLKEKEERLEFPSELEQYL